MNIMFIRRIDMDIKQIKSMGKKLNKFLAKFDDCFSRCESRTFFDPTAIHPVR